MFSPNGPGLLDVALEKNHKSTKKTLFSPKFLHYSNTYYPSIHFPWKNPKKWRFGPKNNDPLGKLKYQDFQIEVRKTPKKHKILFLNGC